MKFNTKQILSSSNVAFGTSGARGLVTDFSPEVCAAFAHAFIAVMKQEFSFDTVALGIDNRPSSESMARAIACAIECKGLKVAYYGVLPTPALAYQAMMNNQPCIMVTGSHIPFDRNGLKFYRPDGEITKSDEVAINKANVNFEAVSLANLLADNTAIKNYINRYTSLFSEPVLSGIKIGIYEHSSAGRDIYCQIFEKLGATVVSLGRSDSFVPIDTEAVSKEDREKAEVWSREFNLDVVFSTDGDGDRPLISDENGNWLRGDVLGLITASLLSIEALAVPVSCNTSIEKSKLFREVVRTKIGSPYVLSEFDELVKNFKSVAGFEANGGFLLGSDVYVNGVLLKALPTRDAILPIIAILTLSNGSISQILELLPQRFTVSDRVKEFESEKSCQLIERFKFDAKELIELLKIKTGIKELIDIDGFRLVLDNDDIIHLRASGNAPELRCYIESDSEDKANNLLKDVLDLLNVLKAQFLN